MLDSPAGPVEATAVVERARRRATRIVGRVSQRAVVRARGRRCRCKLGGRTLPVDVAFGGAFYAIVDAEAAGLPVDAGRLAELRRVGMEIKREVERLAPRRRIRSMPD